jgi:8-oxo-dGTP pyrophosphatase MutT (NUDIX family)
MHSRMTMRSTWDGLHVSQEPPFGAAVVVVRTGPAGRELLLLHRAHHGATYAGDWAWTPPSGARLPDESIELCARRELREESGLALALIPTNCGSPEWPVFLTEAPYDARVVLDAEHDRFEWVSMHDAAQRCLPDVVGRSIAAAVALVTAQA